MLTLPFDLKHQAADKDRYVFFSDEFTSFPGFLWTVVIHKFIYELWSVYCECFDENLWYCNRTQCLFVSKITEMEML